MPKITNQKVHRLHISLLDSQYKKVLQLANDNHTSISGVLRAYIDILIDEAKSEINNSKLKTKDNSPLNLGF